MSKDVLEHRGYCGSIEHDLGGGTLFGSIQFINDILIYEANTLPELQEAFRNSVEEYLETCQEIGKEPDKPYSGTFNIRTTPELHRKIAQKAFKEDLTLNAAVSVALENYVNPNEVVHKHEHNHTFSFEVPFEKRPSVESRTELKLVKS